MESADAVVGAMPEPPPAPSGTWWEGRDESNLVEFPLTSLTDRPPAGRKTLEWRDEVVDRSTGRTVERRVVVSGCDAYGLPTAGDADVLFALVQVSRAANDFATREVAFSRYELARLLGWGDEGKSYRRLESSLNRWVGVTIFFNAWRDKETECWRAEKFHVLDNVSLGGRGGGRSSFSWNRVVFRNLRAGYVYPVDSALYFGLKSSIARRMYRYLSKHFRLRRRDELTFDLSHFAFEKVGLSRSYSDAGQVKRELRRALEELEAAGFLRPMVRERRYAKVGRGSWTITLARAEAVEAPAPARPTVTASPLASRLVELGVTAAVAERLVGTFGEAEVGARVESFEWLVARKDRRVSRNPAGYLVESIRKAYAPPKGFEASSERTRRLAEAAERRRLADDERERVCGARRAGDEREESRLSAYWEALDGAGREELQRRAIEGASAFLARQYRRHAGRGDEREAFYLRAIVEEHIARLPVVEGGGREGE